MKKIIISIVFFLNGLVYAQKGTNQVSVDLADALIMRTLEISYEYYLSEQSSVGISGLFNFEKKSSDLRYNEKQMITPFFRHYFTTSKNWNYFGEVFFGINSGENENSKLPPEQVKYTNGALGVAAGTKYISNGGFVISAMAGIGRNMFSHNSPLFVPRVGLNVGYRF